MSDPILSKRLQEILIELNWSKEKLAEESGLPLETVKNLYYGKTTDPKSSTILAISEATKYSMNCLMGHCPYTPPEQSIIQNYRSCGSHGKSMIEFISKYEASSVKYERELFHEHSIPCILPSGDIRKGILYDTCETVEIKTTIPEAYMAIKIANNDLLPNYCKDDIILLENRFPSNGELASFICGNKIYIRKYIEGIDFYCLKSLHNCDDDIIIKRMDEVQYVGTCCGVIRN